MNSFYAPIEVEIHSLKELREVLDMDIQHIMLDNFSIEDIKEAISLKKEKVTYEISGGVTLDTIENYLIKGIDGISVGQLTSGFPKVDLSLKYRRV